MVHRHYGNLADVFKHVALGEALALLKPAEYWESHSGMAAYEEESPAAASAERRHGIHFAAELAHPFPVLADTAYFRLLKAIRLTGSPLQPPGPLTTIPGSPMLASHVLLQNTRLRRLLHCDFEADCLRSIEALHGKNPLLECVQDDGVTVLRGAAYLLPAEWAPSTLAFLDPFEFDEPTDAGISPLELACELANRQMPTLLWYGFSDNDRRLAAHMAIQSKLQKSRLQGRGVHRFEGRVSAPPAELAERTQWGFGLLGFNLPPAAAERIHQVLEALCRGYAGGDVPPPGGWTYSRDAL